MSVPLISVCIPTYNGAATLAQALDSIVSQNCDELEVVIRDDCSTDQTHQIALDYARRFPFIRVVRGEYNLGMDGNFVQTALLAKGTYVWLMGQDDVFGPGAFDKFREILMSHPEVDFVYFNFRSFGGDLTQEVVPPRLDIGEDAYFTSSTDYFREFDHAPSFLPAAVLRRSFWDDTPYEDFYGTHYVQMGVWLRNFAEGRTYVVADPRFVICRIPEESWKYHGGQMLFEIISGHAEVCYRVFHGARNSITPDVYRKTISHFVKNLPIYAIYFRGKGFRLTPVINARMSHMFSERPVLYWLYVWPLMHLPRPACLLLLKLHEFSGTRWLTRGVRRTISRIAGATRI